ncbi:hypothetical protein [Solibacillus palustris]|nr:hypothetical protein [Solibacillus sp. MA9]
MGKWVVILLVVAVIFMFVQAEMTFRRADKIKKEQRQKGGHE